MTKKKVELEQTQPKPKTKTVTQAKSKPEVQPEAQPKTKPAFKPADMNAWVGSLPDGTKAMAVKVGAAVVALFLLVATVFGVLIYGYKSESSAVQAASSILPYPVEVVNSSFVPYSEYLFEVNANKRAYENNAKLNNQPAVNYTSSDGKKLLKDIRTHALDKLKADAVVAQLASKKKVTVSDKEVNALVDELYKRYGGKDTLLKTLKQIYSWDLKDLKKVVRKQLLAKKLEEKVTSDPALAAQAKSKAADVLKKVNDGGDFAALAKQYSQASDAASGGDLGTVAKGQLPDEMQKAIDSLQAGQVSGLVKTQFGYEIIKVNEKTGDNVKAQHILIKTIDFEEYFNGELAKAKVTVLVKL